MLPNEYILTARICTDKTLGYQFFTDRAHPLASKGGKVYLHRHLASIKLGRWVLPSEDVHHDNEDRADNRPENLIVTTRGAHAALHNRRRGPVPKSPGACEACGGLARRRFCSTTCYSQSRQMSPEESAELERLVWSEPLTKVAQRLGISDVAVAKRCRKLRIKTPPQGHWNRKSSREESNLSDPDL